MGNAFGVALGFQILLCFRIKRVIYKPAEPELGVLGMIVFVYAGVRRS